MNDLQAQASGRQVRRGVAVVLLALVAPPGTLLLLAAVPAPDLVLRSSVGHLVVVSAISACALAVAVAAAAAGRSRDGALVLLGVGCLAIGFLMLAHGLVTPGIGGRPGNLWVGRLPVLAIAAFALCLAAAAWPRPTCGTRSPRTAPTGRPGRPTGPWPPSRPTAAAISTRAASTPSWP